jgi:hypothetical protein
MTKNLRSGVATTLYVLAIALFLALFLAPRGHARVRMTPELALWRALVHEASVPIWRADESGSGEGTWVSRRTGRPWGDDAFLIHEVYLRTAERARVDYSTAAQIYSNRMFEPLSDVERQRLVVGLPLDDANRWAGFMLPGATRAPRAWPWMPSVWQSSRPGLEYAYELAREVVQYDLEAVLDFGPCEAPVDDWGGRQDHERARALGLVPVACGNSANQGYARPSQIRLRAESGEWPVIDPD